MHPTERRRRTSAAKLAEATKQARKEAKTAGWLTEDTLARLCALLAIYERDLLQTGNYADRPRETHAALRLLRRYDPSHDVRNAKVAEIDRLTTICDQIMDCGLIPAPVYLCGLAEAVLDYEHVHSCGEDGHITSTAWDVLAQAEAGLGQCVEPEHYDQAYARHAQLCCARDNVTPFRVGREVSSALAN